MNDQSRGARRAFFSVAATRLRYDGVTTPFGGAHTAH
jgi:hypothetical protein